MRVRNPKSVVDEIEELIIKYHIPGFMFVDSVFNIPRAHAEAICRELIDRKLTTVPWTAWFDIKQVDSEFIQLVKNAGCDQLSFSPDALTDAALQGMQKTFTEKEVRTTLKTLKKVPGMRIGYSIFVNTPGLTVGGYLKTLWFFVKENLLLVPRRKGGIGLSWIRIEPYTELHQLAIKQGMLSPETDLLPKNEAELKQLFYLQPNLKWLDFITHRVIDIFKFAGRLVGRKFQHV